MKKWFSHISLYVMMLGLFSSTVFLDPRTFRNGSSKRSRAKKNNKQQKVSNKKIKQQKKVQTSFENKLKKAYKRIKPSPQTRKPDFFNLEEKKMVIIMPSFNNAQWYKQNLDSVLRQNYSNYRVIYIDDISTDKTAELVQSYLAGHSESKRVLFIKNQEKMLAMANIYYTVHNYCEDDEIVVMVDGDDFLAHPNVLKHLNYLYSKKDILLTFGNNICLSNLKTCWWSMPIPSNIVAGNKFREWPHGQTHLRTFYTWLFKRIDEEDLKHEGDFYKMTYDVAMLLPMIEMAGERHQFIPDVLYIYNDLNSINDHKKNGKLQHSLNKVIRSKERYSRLIEAEIPIFMKRTGK